MATFKNLKSGQAPKTALDRAMTSVKPAIWTAVVFSFFINILALTAPLYMMQVYDRVLSSRNVTTLVVLTILIAFLYLVSALLESVRTKLLVRAGVKFDEEINQHTFSAVQKATLSNPSPDMFRRYGIPILFESSLLAPVSSRFVICRGCQSIS